MTKRLELLRDLLPKAVRIDVLVDPISSTTTESTLRGVDAAAQTMGMQIQVFKASTIREIDAAFAAFANERPDALLSVSARSCSTGVSNWPSWRHVMRSLQSMRNANMPKSAG